MKFNPPPNWPAPPEGFTPGPEWTPDPNLPAPPPGWQLWVEDDAVLPGETSEGVRHHQQAVRSFWIGVGVFVAAALVTGFSAKSGGFLWYGGLIVGVIAIIRSIASYVSSRKEGAPALSGAAKGVAAVGILAVVGTGIFAASSFYEAETMNTNVGSCWDATDEQNAVVTSCDGDYDFKAISEVSDPADCPSELYFDASDGDGILCLEEAAQG